MKEDAACGKNYSKYGMTPFGARLSPLVLLLSAARSGPVCISIGGRVSLNTYSIPAWVLLIIALTFLGFAFLLWKKSQLGKAKIAKVAVNIIPVDKSKTLTYPLKCYVQLRNNSATCADISLFEYTPNTVTLKAFVLDVLQLKMRDWTPSDQGLDRLAVLPHQLFRAWIGVDENKFNADQLERLRGKIGTLVFLVNGERVNIDL